MSMEAYIDGMVGTIDAAVDAVVGEIERGEHHDAVAVEALFHLACELLVALDQVWLVAVEKHGGLAVGQALAFGGFFDDFFNQSTVALVLFSVG